VKPTPAQYAQGAKLGLSAQDVEDLMRTATDRYDFGMARLLRVRDKHGHLIPMEPTRIHRKFKKWQRKFALTVKPRQIYFTTFNEADYYLDCVEGDGIRALLINLDVRVTEEIFDRVHTFHDNFALKPILPKPKRETTRKLSWQNGASFDAITVKNDDGEESAKTLGRSCTQQRVHVTEAGYMNHYRAFMNGLSDSIPKEGRAVIESTGNGATGGFYEDCMEVFEKGENAAPGVWVLGDRSLHFFAWWEHPEYTLDTDPLPEFRAQMSEDDLRKLLDSEADHVAEMAKDPELSEEFRQHAINWRRWWLFNKKGFLRDPEGALRIMDQEYPGHLRMAFQTTGSSFFNMGLTDLRREEWKRYNREMRLPLRCRMASDLGLWAPTPDTAGEVLIWAPPYDKTKEAWTDRYVVGGDVGGGTPTSDPDVIWVKDRLLRRYVAVAHGHFGPDKWASIGMALGYYFHTARLNFEANNHGVGVQIAVWKAQYPNVYRHDDEADGYQGMGFLTTETTRRKALEYLKSVYEDRARPLLIAYEGFYKEAAGFAIPPGKTKPEAKAGENDDLIMGAMVTEATCASMPEPLPVHAVYEPEPGTVGYLAMMAGGGGRSGGLGNVL
jgi:hypothetical protein